VAKPAPIADSSEEPYLPLGKVGDLLWLRIPEIRHEIFEMVKEDFEYAIDHDSERVNRPSPMFLNRLFHREFLEPAIRANKASDVRRGLGVMVEMLSFADGPPPWGLYGTALWHGVIDYLEAADLAVLRQTDPEAVAAIKNHFDISAWGA
jgi:hypothetical protein